MTNGQRNSLYLLHRREENISQNTFFLIIWAVLPKERYGKSQNDI